MSSDRIFRVRATQPYEGKKSKMEISKAEKSACAIVAKQIVVGDLCAFKTENYYRIG